MNKYRDAGLSGGEDVSWWVLIGDRATRESRRVDHLLKGLLRMV